MDKNIENVEDLLIDENFLAWYFKTGEESMNNWNNRIAADPALKELAQQASGLLAAIKIKETGIEPEQLNDAERRLMKKIEERTGTIITAMPLASNTRKRLFLPWAAAAAIILLVLSFWWGQKYFTGNDVSIETQYGRIMEQVLPDGSEITLNANSKLTYKNKWKEGQDREVWLKGEGFFHVQKTAEKSRFIVHTGHFDIIVTGTQFNVVNRTDKANVLLKEGSVLIKAGNGTETAMKPGEFIEYYNEQLEKKPAKGLQVMAWKDRKFIFEKTPMKDVGASITELYGVPVKFGDKAVAMDSTISGILPNDNLDTLIQLLQTNQNLEIIKTNQEILIRARH